MAQILFINTMNIRKRKRFLFMTQQLYLFMLYAHMILLNITGHKLATSL